MSRFKWHRKFVVYEIWKLFASKIPFTSLCFDCPNYRRTLCKVVRKYSSYQNFRKFPEKSEYGIFLVNYRLAASYLTEKHLPLICSWVCLWAFLSSCFSKQLCIAIFVIQLYFHEQCSGNWLQNISFCWWYYLWLRIYITIYEKNKCFILLPLCLSLNTLL